MPVRFVNFSAVLQRLTFVDNATAIAVLHSLPWRAGERIIIADCAYPGVKNAARFVAERGGLELVDADRLAAETQDMPAGAAAVLAGE